MGSVVTASSSPEPATPQWTWTDEAREELRRALGLVYPPTSVAEWRIDAVLAALAPHVALQVAELRRLVAGLEAENDNYHADLVRVIGERDAALAKLDAVKALAKLAADTGWLIPHSEVYNALAADPQRPVLPPGDAQEPQTPAPGSPGTPETLSVPLSAPQDPHGA